MGRANSKSWCPPPNMSLVQMLSRIPTQWIILLSSHWSELSHMSHSPTGNWGKWVFKLTPCCNEYVDGMRPIGQAICVGACITCMPPGHLCLLATAGWKLCSHLGSSCHQGLYLMVNGKDFIHHCGHQVKTKPNNCMLLLLSRFSRVQLCATP